MQSSPMRDFEIGRKTREVVTFHDDPQQNGRPLYLLLAGAGLALAALGLALLLAYRAWYPGETPQNQAIAGLGFLFVFYVLGVFLFSLAYELYDTGRALRLTLIVSAFSVLGLVFLAGALASLSKAPRAGTTAARGSTGRNRGGVLGSILSFDADEDDYETSVWPFATSQSEPIAPSEFLITCRGCKKRFRPAPPSAICPACGAAAL